jgi:hypothetical protein
MRLRITPATIFYVLVALVATAPAWIVKHPPMTDLPYQVATIRVLHSLHDPAYGLADNFVLTLGRTQYLFYYALGSLLSYVVGVTGANVALMSVYLGGTVLAMRELLQALGKDPRLCLLTIPLLPNVLFMYGLFPFLVGIPLMFWGLALAVRHFESPTRATGAALGLVAILLFYTHVAPFAVFAVGCAAMFPWRSSAKWPFAAAPLVPGALLFVWWAGFTEAGKIARGAVGSDGGGGPRPLNASLQDLPNWIGDIFRDTSDEAVLLAFAVIVVLAVGLAQGERDESRPISRAYVLVPIACVLGYFFTAEGRGFIWPLAQRFPVLALLTAIPMLRMPRGLRGLAATGASLVVAGWSVVNVCAHFIDFERNEVGDFEGALDAIPSAKKVCALIYDRGSSITNQMAFIHFGSYYQAQKGGVVMFTFAGYPHWPFDFRPGRYPPPGGPARPRWEWTPEQVPVQSEISPYYDYVLTRGAGFHPPPGTFHLKWHGERWQVWQRDG